MKKIEWETTSVTVWFIVMIDKAFLAKDDIQSTLHLFLEEFQIEFSSAKVSVKTAHSVR